MSAVGLAMMGSAAIGGGLGILGGALNKPDQLKQGYDVVQMPQYSWTEPNRKLLSDYLSGGLQSIQAGNPPTWWQNAQPKLQAGMSRQNALTYFGNPGTRQGAVGNAMSIGAMAGLKGKRAMTPGLQANQEYANREAAINDYLTQLGVNVTQQSENSYMQGLMGMPGGPESQIVNLMGGVSQGNNWAGQIAPLANALGQQDWGNQQQQGSVGNWQNQYASQMANTTNIPYYQQGFNPASYAGNNVSQMPASWQSMQGQGISVPNNYTNASGGYGIPWQSA